LSGMFKHLETVAVETFASRATSSRVGRSGVCKSYSGLSADNPNMYVVGQLIIKIIIVG